MQWSVVDGTSPAYMKMTESFLLEGFHCWVLVWRDILLFQRIQQFMMIGSNMDQTVIIHLV